MSNHENIIEYKNNVYIVCIIRVYYYTNYSVLFSKDCRVISERRKIKIIYIYIAIVFQLFVDSFISMYCNFFFVCCPYKDQGKTKGK